MIQTFRKQRIIARLIRSTHYGLMSKTSSPALALLAFSCLALACPTANLRATTLISDTFSTAGTLNGTTPDTTVAGAKWTALTGASAATSNGTSLSMTTSTTQTNVLDLGAGYFASNPGIYTLSMDVTLPSGSGTSWIGLGFVVNPQTAGSLSTTTSGTGLNLSGGTNGGSPWILNRQNGQTNVYRGAGTNSSLLSTATGAFASGNTYTMTLVLNTSLANWTLDSYMNATQLDLNGAGAGNTAVFASNPTDIRYVGFSTGGGGAFSATIDNFTLTAVPEASAATLAACGIGFLALLRTWRR